MLMLPSTHQYKHERRERAAGEFFLLTPTQPTGNTVCPNWFTTIGRHYSSAATFLAPLLHAVVLTRLCSVSLDGRSKDRLFVNQWVELSGGMTCLYKLRAPRAAPEHVMAPTNVFSHRYSLSLSSSLPLFIWLSSPLTSRNPLFQASSNYV